MDYPGSQNDFLIVLFGSLDSFSGQVGNARAGEETAVLVDLDVNYH